MNFKMVDTFHIYIYILGYLISCNDINDMLILNDSTLDHLALRTYPGVVVTSISGSRLSS